MPNEQMRYLSTIRNNDVIEMIPLPNIKGNSTAAVQYYSMISSSSVNMDNAWDFVKILLSETCQCNSSLDITGIGVSTDYIDVNLERIAKKNINVEQTYMDEIKQIYKKYDSAFICGLSSGRKVMESFSDYMRAETPPNISELKDNLVHEMTFWFTE